MMRGVFLCLCGIMAGVLPLCPPVSCVLQVTQWPWSNLLETVQLVSLDRPLTLTSPSTDSSSRGRAGPWVAPSLPS